MKTYCSICNQEYDISEKYVDKQAECKACGGKFIIKNYDNINSEKIYNDNYIKLTDYNKSDHVEEETLYEKHPSMFRNRPILFIIFIILIILYGLGLLLLLIWWLKALSSKLTITNKKTTYRKGLLSKYTNDVWHTDVRNVQVGQNLFQRIFNVGSVGISSAGQGTIEIMAYGFREPEEVKELIYSFKEK
ncbi:MAG TPA: PH domain-containing protein [Victivallales bacterium]|nr:PH domain-containing protein [Victivallales bacterium]